LRFWRVFAASEFVHTDIRIYFIGTRSSNYLRVCFAFDRYYGPLSKYPLAAIRLF